MELMYCGYCGGKGCTVCRTPERMPSGLGWTMEDELTFLRNLGRWQPWQPRRAERKDLLKGYLAGLEARTKWGNLQPERLRETALQLLVGEVTSESADRAGRQLREDTARRFLVNGA